MIKSKESILTRVSNLLAPDRVEIRNIYIFAIFSGLLSLGLPLAIQVIINFIQLGQLSASWFLMVGLVVVAIGFSGVLNILQLKITENLQQRIFTRSAFEFAHRIPKLKLEALREYYNPEINARFFDTLTIQKAISKLLIDFMSASLQIIFGLSLLAFYHNFFILFGLILLILLYLIIRFTSKKGYQTSLKESSYKYSITNWLNEINNAKTSFRNSSNGLNLREMDKKIHNYLNARKSHFAVLVQQYGYLISFKILIAVSLLIVGGILVVNQQMNIGQFVAAEIVIVLVLSSVEKIILNLDLVYDVLTAIEKIGQVTDFPIEKDSKNHEFIPNQQGLKVEIRNLSYHAEELNAKILNDCSFVVEPGQKLCIISDSSVSASVLFLNILSQFENHEGHIFIDNLPQENLNKESISRSIGTLLTTDKLVFGSIADNIGFGCNNVNLNQIAEVSQKLGLDNFINSIDEKYEAIINPDFNFIPQDIQIKILIARAMIKKPKLMLLEDPTVGMNNNQKATIINCLREINDCSFIISSHDEIIHQTVDQIIEINEGKIIFKGSFENYQKQK